METVVTDTTGTATSLVFDPDPKGIVIGVVAMSAAIALGYVAVRIWKKRKNNQTVNTVVE